MDNTQPLTYLLTAISQVGFPIVLTGYLLIRFEKKLEILTETISQLIDVINKDISEEGHRNEK
ncbi:YvrJ family protein [uncultured Paenibacillus sp.]|uniref:YvrJ family protein n=1 Tax=uncultured Paenibacillus sp. TaxID=227322 RepID=UPI0015B03170|nr:YvrJ family protein [uncultured Paenibacillus sp.]DAI82624.1 MAG TPA: YvrJ protein family protein [Caudoviricetes sp.]